MHRRPPHLLVITALLLGACSSGSPDSDIGSFSDIAQSEPIIEFDPSGTAATLLVTTNQAARVRRGRRAPLSKRDPHLHNARGDPPISERWGSRPAR